MATEQSLTTEVNIPLPPTQSAFDKHKAAIVVIKLDDIREARVDLNAMCVRSFTTLPFLREMRAQIVAKLPDIDLAVYDSIEERIYAVHYCNTLWQAKIASKENVAVLADGLEELYEKALGAYDILILFGLASRDPKKRLQSTGGYGALTNNLSLVLGVLRGVTPDVLSQTPLKPRDLVQIENALLVFQTAWGQREFTSPTRDESGVLRAQAFTYLYDAYELARRAALYLHGYDRGDELVPSLFISLGDRSKRAAKTSGAPSETPAAPGQPASGSQAASDATPFITDNAANLPMTSPFEKTK